jgi:hypothetical protein
MWDWCHPLSPAVTRSTCVIVLSCFLCSATYQTERRSAAVGCSSCLFLHRRYPIPPQRPDITRSQSVSQSADNFPLQLHLCGPSTDPTVCALRRQDQRLHAPLLCSCCVLRRLLGCPVHGLVGPQTQLLLRPTSLPPSGPVHHRSANVSRLAEPTVPSARQPNVCPHVCPTMLLWCPCPPRYGLIVPPLRPPFLLDLLLNTRPPFSPNFHRRHSPRPPFLPAWPSPSLAFLRPIGLHSGLQQ